jgi:prepilin-type N-terminal cleavage/methylation domain-containing protein/prepilin-type processing-associated H-X9-DG protein
MGLQSLEVKTRFRTVHLKGFSLIELLVVVAVMGLLMSLLLPALRRARQQAQSVCCLSNLRQMTIAATNYAHANRHHYPLAYYTTKVNEIRYYYAWDFTTYKDWSASPAVEVVEPGLLWQGDTNEQIQQCPSFRAGHNWLADPYTGYNYNTSYIGINETVFPVDSAKITEVQSPAKTALLGDGQFSGGANKFMRAPFSNPRDASFSDPGRAAGTQGYRHAEKTNVAFCDGHAESWKFLSTNTDPIGQEQIEKYNERHKEKIGFLSEDNYLYDLN